MSEPTDLRAVVFDLDGLMFNTEGLYQQVGTELLRRRGKRFEPELLDRMMGRRTPVALQMMIDWHRLSDTVETLSGESEQIFAAILQTQLAQMPGLPDCSPPGIGRHFQSDRHQQQPAVHRARAGAIQSGPAISVHSHGR